MRIAVLASNFIRLPPNSHAIPEGYSGAPELVMSDITEELVRRGHDVTLFASGDSVTSAKLVAVTKQATGLDPEIGIAGHVDFEHLLIYECYKRAKAGQFDVVHSIFDVRSATYAPFVTAPTVVTMHSPVIGNKRAILSAIPDTQWYVSVSNAQRKTCPELRYAATVYHGIDVSQFPFSADGGNALISVGRMVDKKGVAEAIAASSAVGIPLVLAGTPVPGDPFWEKNIAPHIDGVRVRHIGFIEPSVLSGYFQQSLAFLFPVKWEEPFGLSAVQSMASGTPVVAFARGSLPEIVRDGETGFLVNESEEMTTGKWIIKKTGIPGLAEALERIKAMDPATYRAMRKACRSHAERHFTVGRMVDDYEKVYTDVISKASA